MVGLLELLSGFEQLCVCICFLVLSIPRGLDWMTHISAEKILVVNDLQSARFICALCQHWLCCWVRLGIVWPYVM